MVKQGETHVFARTSNMKGHKSVSYMFMERAKITWSFISFSVRLSSLIGRLFFFASLVPFSRLARASSGAKSWLYLPFPQVSGNIRLNPFHSMRNLTACFNRAFFTRACAVRKWFTFSLRPFQTQWQYFQQNIAAFHT